MLYYAAKQVVTTEDPLWAVSTCPFFHHLVVGVEKRAGNLFFSPRWNCTPLAGKVHESVCVCKLRGENLDFDSPACLGKEGSRPKPPRVENKNKTSAEVTGPLPRCAEPRPKCGRSPETRTTNHRTNMPETIRACGFSTKRKKCRR